MTPPSAVLHGKVVGLGASMLLHGRAWLVSEATGAATTAPVGKDGNFVLRAPALPRRTATPGYLLSFVAGRTAKPLGTVVLPAGADVTRGFALRGPKSILRFRRGEGLWRSHAGPARRGPEADRAKVVVGTVTKAEARAAVAQGVLRSYPGQHKTWAVSVSDLGGLYRFATPGQLAADGYGGTAAVAVPGTGRLATVGFNSGS